MEIHFMHIKILIVVKELKIRKCPFCGNQIITLYCCQDLFNKSLDRWFLCCEDCGVEMKNKSKIKLIKNWNNRNE